MTKRLGAIGWMGGGCLGGVAVAAVMYVAVGLATAAFIHCVLDELDFAGWSAVTLGWPVIWFMAFLFVAAAAGAP